MFGKRTPRHRRRHARVMPGLALGVALCVTGGVLSVAQAVERPKRLSPLWERDISETEAVTAPGAKAERELVVAHRKTNDRQAQQARAEQKADWPGPAKRTLDIAHTADTPVSVGELPVTLAFPKSAKKAASGTASVQVAGHEAATSLGIKGVLLSVRAGQNGPADIGLDYGRFASAYGGGWAGRLGLVRLPQCALTTPDRNDCRRSTPVASRNDISEQSVTGTVSLSASAPTVLALAATASGESASGSGTYQATQLSPSATWEAGASSGAFTWSYPMAVPPAPGSTPSLTLGYNSGSVDGKTASTNNQSTQVGEGFDLSANSYVERSYGQCDEDGQADKKDLCWKYDNASLVLNGKATELVKDDTTGTWRLENDDDSTVTVSTGGDNGDNDGEYWTVTTGDGIRYVFGMNKLPGAGTERTNSVWTVPVFGDDSGEPGYDQGSAFADRAVTQAWRWNLDYVEDLHDNATSYWYAKESNHYAKNGASTGTASYVRGGYLTKILYGQRAGALFSGVTSAKVEFTYAERCTAADCSDLKDSTSQNWPDVPFDAICASGTDCDAPSPNFFSRKRLTAVDTFVWSAGTSAFTAVDTWTLTQQYLDGGDIGDSSDQTLVLKSITRTGKDGTAIALAPVTFTYDMRHNRVDATDDILPLSRPRIRTVTSETGAITDVTFSGPECVRGSNMPADEDDNTKPCYPQYWHINGAEETSIDWFHKYRVLAVVTSDPAGLNANVVNSYAYADPDWHYNDSPLTPADERTWSIWRGYGTVTSTKGTGSNLSKVTSVYLQGMDGDRLLGSDGELDPGARRSVSVSGVSVPGLSVPAQKDSDQFAGFLRQQVTYNGTAPITVTVNDPWSKRTATQHKSYADTEAYYVRTGKATSSTYLTATGTWRSRTTTTTYDDHGLVAKADNTGDTAKSGDESCTRTWYARNADLGINSLVSRTRVVGRACSVTESDLSLPANAATAGDVLSDTATVYDSATATTWSAAQTPTKGEATWTGRPTGYPATATGGERNPASWQRAGRATYDALGRSLTTTDADGNSTSVVYTPTTTGPLTRTQTTNAETQKSYTFIAPARGLTTKAYDANNNLTESEYDALGRTTAVWLPNRSHSGGQKANYVFRYSVTSNAPSWTSMGTLKADGDTYLTSYTVYDSLLRVLQSQTPGATSGRILTDTRYDSRGLAHENYADIFDAAAPSGTYTRAEYGETPKLTKTAYDAAGRPVTTTFLVGGVQKWQTTTAYTGDSTATTGIPGGSAGRTVTDALGRTVEQRQYASTSSTDTEFGSTVGADHTDTRYTYRPDGRKKTITGPDGAVWSYTYDLYGRQVSMADPDKGTTTTGYTPLDQVSWTRDSVGRAVISAYDPLGRVTDTWKSAVGADLTSASVLAAQKTDANKLTHFAYDTVTGGKGKPASSTRYVGGAATGSAYTQSVTAYDSVYHATGTRLTLPSTDPMVTSKALASNVLDFSSYYNVDGTLQWTKEPAAGGLGAETIEYGYNDRGLGTTLTAGGQGIVLGTTYTDLSQVSTRRLGVSEATGTMKVDIVHDYEDGTNRLLRTEVRGQAHAYDALNLHYAYDTVGNVTRISDTTTLGGAGAADNQCFDYDGYQRLTDVWTPTDGDCAAERTTTDLGGAAPYWTSYTYNDAGQRITETEHGTATSTTTTYCYRAGSTQPHTLMATTTTACGGVTAQYGYDTAGNTTKRPDGTDSQSLLWNDEGDLARVTETAAQGGATRTTDYVYDAAGELLVRRDAQGESVLYLGGSEVHLDTSGSTAKYWSQRYYKQGDSTVALRSNESGTGKLTWLAGDNHGTSTVAIDAGTQAITRRYTAPFGETRGKQADWPDDKAFLGKPKDDSTGLTQVGARQYDAGIGQFISVDPVLQDEVGQTLNGYSYAAQNPATVADPSGLGIPECHTGVITGCSNGVPDEDSVYHPERERSTVSDTGTGTGTGSGTGNGSGNGRQDEMGRRAAAVYRLGLTLAPEVYLNPNATQLVSMWFMGATPGAYQFDERDKMTQDVKRHIWLDVVRRFLTHRKGTKLGETIKGLAYKTAYGAAMNDLPLKGMMAGEVSDAITQLLGDNDPDTAEGATRAALGSFNLKATVTGYNKLNRRGTVEFEITQSMTVESLTRGVSKEGYEGGAKDPNAMAMSNAAHAVFPGGQRDLKMTFRWSENLLMSEPGR